MDSLLAFEDERLKRAQSDVVHDLLAFLAEQMIEMNKQKQAEVQGFLKWLEREIGINIESLMNKTAIRNYHEGSFENLLSVLKKNEKRIAVKPSTRSFQENLEREFNKSLAKLRPLRARIQLTDALIDQIVYRLYGLTKEEIRMVEDL